MLHQLSFSNFSGALAKFWNNSALKLNKLLNHFLKWKSAFSYFRNEYINKVFPGAWFRSNFEDLLSYRGANKLEWFEVLEGADCSPVPATVNAGKPPRDICLGKDSSRYEQDTHADFY